LWEAEVVEEEVEVEVAVAGEKISFVLKLSDFKRDDKETSPL
jgi:hypothetical protein